MKKKLNLNKYSFLFYLKGDFFCWIFNNQNYLKLAKNNLELQKASPWRWKGLNNQKNDNLDLPSSIIDGKTAEKYARKYFEKLYPDLKIYDFKNNFEVDKIKQKTKEILDNEDNFILYEGAFEYQQFKIRNDIIIKKNQKISFYELKAITLPQALHGLDLLFQKEIIKKNAFQIKKWDFNLLTLNPNFRLNSQKRIEEQIENLFCKWDSYFTSKPKNPDLKTWSHYGKPIETLILEKKYSSYFSDFEKHLKKISDIQLLDSPPKQDFTINNFSGINSEYQKFFLKYNDVKEKDSIFEYSGDRQFSNWKKANYFNNEIKTLFDLNDRELISQQNYQKLLPYTKQMILTNQYNFLETKDPRIIKDLTQNCKLFKHIIQKKSNFYKKAFILKEKIREHLNQYQKVIYMFDFETVNLVIPKFNNSKVYEQIPYQYSIHIILDKDDFDSKTMKNIIHLEWLAKEKDFEEQFWKNFTSAINKYGEGSYVSYNKSFENQIINNRINKINDLKEQILLQKIVNKTIDLMEPFVNKWYYHYHFLGSYSIKLVGKHFAPQIDYQKLDNRVQKGDQSAKQCKIWLLESTNESEESWKNVRKAMLKYCCYDTLSMIYIYENLKKIIETNEE